MRGYIALETGRVFSGRLLGAPVETGGEVVYLSGKTGDHEILTDASYGGRGGGFTASQRGW